MYTRPSYSLPRRGAIAPLGAILMVPLMAMVAFSIDIGWITHTQNQLQVAADAAALAGAGKLPDYFVQYYLPGQTSSNQTTIRTAAQSAATTAATNFASYNRAGNVSALTLLSSDIEFGVTSSSGTYTANSGYSPPFPNTVKVTLRRDSTANTSLGLFFARVLGINSVDLTATARATIYSGTVNSFTTTGTFKARILPMTYDVNHWNNYLATGKDPDGGSSTDSNGNPTLGVYPSIKFTGNFGELSLNQSNNGSSTISDWINNGVSATDLQQDVAAGLLPLSAHDSTLAPDWKGNPGMKTSTIHTADDNVGELYLLPLYKPVNSSEANYQAGSGNGSHYYYTIVQFVGIKISSADNKSIVVQPSSLIDPMAILSGMTPATAPSASNNYALPTTFGAPKLTN